MTNEPSKQQPLKEDRCPICGKPFGNFRTGNNARSAVYMGMEDVWVHSGRCRMQWNERQAREQPC